MRVYVEEHTFFPLATSLHQLQERSGILESFFSYQNDEKLGKVARRLFDFFSSRSKCTKAHPFRRDFSHFETGVREKG